MVSEESCLHLQCSVPAALRLAAVCLALAGPLGLQAPAHAQSSVIRVMDWNIHHGIDTSSVDNLARVADWIVQVNADVVSLNEVEKQNGYTNNADQPAVLKALLESRTSFTWHTCFAQRDGAARGQGNLVLSRIAIESCTSYLLSASRSVAQARLRVNGSVVSVFSTHLDDGSAATRATQVGQLVAWAALAPEGRILAGDFNASATSTELQPMQADYVDTWAAAVAAGTAVAYPGNTAGNTRNSRIDYVWRSKGAGSLSLQSVQVYDSGSVSDHRPLVATFAVGTSAPTPAPRAPANIRVIKP